MARSLSSQADFQRQRQSRPDSIKKRSRRKEWVISLVLVMVAVVMTNMPLRVGSIVINGTVEIVPAPKRFQLSWSLDTRAEEITFLMTSDGGFDWFAFGLHEDESGGMLDAEVFMCSPEVSNLNGQFCQNRNTKAGHKTPALDKVNYLRLHAASRASTNSSAEFSRKIAKRVMSYDIQNASVMVIFARGA